MIDRYVVKKKVVMIEEVYGYSATYVPSEDHILPFFLSILLPSFSLSYPFPSLPSSP